MADLYLHSPYIFMERCLIKVRDNFTLLTSTYRPSSWYLSFEFCYQIFVLPCFGLLDLGTLIEFGKEHKLCSSSLYKVLDSPIISSSSWLRHYATNWKVAGSSPG
jgi:hypothetical protein